MDPAEQTRQTGREFDAAAAHFDDIPYWAPLGRLTVERAGLEPGWRVLDACCGTGASAIPAARAVGPSGQVLGVDLSERMLDRARAKALAANLANTEFRRGDIMATGLPDRSVDAVVCCFGVFFVPDQLGAAAELWRLVRPGGRMVFTTWGERPFEPAMSTFFGLLGDAGVELPEGREPPYAALVTPAGLEALMRGAGAGDVVCETVVGTLPLGPGDWWTIVVGSGLRGFVDQLAPGEREELRRATHDAMASIAEVRMDVVIGVARR